MSGIEDFAPPELTAPLANVLDALQAAGEISRLRILALVAETELTVSEIVLILGQSQPRVSRHLRLLVEAGMVERHREGAWAFFHIAQDGAEAAIARNIVRRIQPGDPLIRADRQRLEEVRRARASRAADYFAAQAEDWNRLRSLHVPEEQVEQAILDIVGDAAIQSLLDLGTGTGRMLELLAPLAVRAVGVDQSPAMLNVARTGIERAGIERAGLRNVQLRQGDLYALPVDANSFDLVVIHMVLHYLDDPARALREAARCLRPGGRLIVVDFAPHHQEFLREEHQHRRLGFDNKEIAAIFRDIGIELREQASLEPAQNDAGKLTVSIWVGRDPRIVGDVIHNIGGAVA
ncbi:MAG: ArsR/SmtB family transcription factor [Beijerinckiaceae bacterium]